jgi:hypothetical protein
MMSAINVTSVMTDFGRCQATHGEFRCGGIRSIGISRMLAKNVLQP